MCSRTKSVRLPTDFMEMVWWNRSIACSFSMPKRCRYADPYGGNVSNSSTCGIARRRLRSVLMSAPNPAN